MHSYSSYTSMSDATWGARTSGTWPSQPRACRCATHCRCGSSGPCRCQRGCLCSRPRRLPVPGVADMWAESRENQQELGRRFAPRPYPARNDARARSPMWLRSRAMALLNRRRQINNLWQRRRGLNHYLARRFGWGRHVHRISQLLGCAPCAPGSQRFTWALARWQRRNGFAPTGVLTPRVWQLLRRRLGRARSRQYPTYGAAPMHGTAQPIEQSPQYAAPQPPSPVEPPDTPIDSADATQDAGPEQPPASPDDAGEPAADAPSEGEFGVGFRARRFPRGSSAYQRARRPYLHQPPPYDPYPYMR